MQINNSIIKLNKHNQKTNLILNKHLIRIDKITDTHPNIKHISKHPYKTNTKTQTNTNKNK